MDAEPLLTRDELISRATMAKKYEKTWSSKAEYDAHDARVDETLRRLRTLAEKAQAEVDGKRTASEGP